jgi:hypothetical protein
LLQKFRKIRFRLRESPNLMLVSCIVMLAARGVNYF